MVGAETEVKASQRLPYLGIHPINSHQTLTLLWTTRSVYQKEHDMVVSGRSPGRALQIQRQMLTTNYWTGHGVPNGGAGGWSRGAKGVYSPMGRIMISATQMPLASQGLNYQPRSTHSSSQK